MDAPEATSEPVRAATPSAVPQLSPGDAGLPVETCFHLRLVEDPSRGDAVSRSRCGASDESWDLDDPNELTKVAGKGYLREVLRGAEAGQLDARSWHYWHYRLGLAEYGKRPVPPMPARKTA